MFVCLLAVVLGNAAYLASNFCYLKLLIVFFSVDLNTSAEQVLGMHDDAIKCVEHCPTPGMITWKLQI